MPRRRLLATASLVLFAVTPAFATNGYFLEGYGVQSEGEGGVAIASPQDSLAIATNPASASDLGNRADVGGEIFSPSRGASITGNAFGADQSYSGNGIKNFLLPQGGVIKQFGDYLSAGVALYGNGGMNTDYRSNPYARFGASGKAGVNLEQAFVTPTIAYRFAPGQSIGLGVNLGYQLFKAEGLGVFSGFSEAPSDVSGNHSDGAFGEGVKFGYLGHLGPQFSIGAFWQSKTYFSKFSKYSGLFAGQGGFDTPSTYGVGVNYALTPALSAASDLSRIDYAGVPSVGDSFAVLLAGKPLGSSGGPGFGWRNITVIKFGVRYRISPQWQLRAGYAYNTQPIPANQTFLNILAPGVVQNHITAGTTWTAASGLEVSGFAAYAPTTTVNGSGSIPPGYPPGGFGGGEANIHLSETSFGLAVGWKFN